MVHTVRKARTCPLASGTVRKARACPLASGTGSKKRKCTVVVFISGDISGFTDNASMKTALNRVLSCNLALYCCQGCSDCLACWESIGWATAAVWICIKKYSLIFSEGMFVFSEGNSRDLLLLLDGGFGSSFPNTATYDQHNNIEPQTLLFIHHPHHWAMLSSKLVPSAGP